MPLPGRDHQPRSLALSRLQPELAGVELILVERGIIVTHESIRQ
jgi:hypothetical protein